MKSPASTDSSATPTSIRRSTPAGRPPRPLADRAAPNLAARSHRPWAATPTTQRSSPRRTKENTDGSPISEANQACLDAHTECAHACEACAYNRCIPGGDVEMAACAQQCLDCAALSQLCVTLWPESHRSPLIARRSDRRAVRGGLRGLCRGVRNPRRRGPPGLRAPAGPRPNSAAPWPPPENPPSRVGRYQTRRRSVPLLLKVLTSIRSAATCSRTSTCTTCTTSTSGPSPRTCRPAPARRHRQLLLHRRSRPRLLDELQACLGGHFDIEHSTFQLEPASQPRQARTRNALTRGPEIRHHCPVRST